MAAKNQVTLTFAGDSTSLEKTFKGVSDGAQRTEKDIDGLGDRARGLDKVIGDGGRRFGDYGKGLGGVGDRADEVDTRMMGLSDGIQGVTDLMGGNGKLRPHEMAMAFSDLGSATYNTLIPSLQSAGEGVKKLADRFGGMKSAVLATGAAIGAAGLVLALKQYNDAADEARGKDLATEFEKTGDAAELFAKVAEGDVFAKGDMANAFDELLAKSPVLAQSFLDQAAASGELSDEFINNAQQAIDEVADSEDRLATSIRSTTDAMRARMDPFFAVIDADRQHRDALQAQADAEAAVTEAIRLHGEGSTEAVAAQQALNDAELASAESALGQEFAVRELAQSMLEAGGTTEEIIAHLQGLADQGTVSQSVVDEVARSLRDVPDRVDPVIQAHDHATAVINAVGDQARALDGTISNITIQASLVGGGAAYAALTGGAGHTGRTRAGGGLVEYMALGGMAAGPKGTDTVPAWLTPGEMVINRGQQMELWNMANGRGRYGGGGVTLNFYGPVAGEREFIRIVREEIQRGGLGGLAA